MAVRNLDGATHKIVLGSTGDDVANGDYTIVAIVKPVALTSGEAFVSMRGSGALVGCLGDNGSGRLADYTDTLDTQAQVNMTAGDWQILALRHPAGTTNVRFSHKQLGSGVWTHANSSTTHPDITGIVDAIVIGGFNPANALGVKNMRIAAAAIYTANLADGDIEAIQTTPASQFLLDLDPLKLWNFNQADISTHVIDLVTGDDDQTDITGTTVVTGDDPPGWDFTVTIIPPLACSWRNSGGASNADETLSIGGAISSVSVGGDLFDAVDNPDRIAGLIDYRLIYAHNDDTADGVGVAYVPTNLESGRSLAIGAATQSAGTTVTAIANDTTAPAGVTFSTPTTPGAGVSLGTIPAGSYKGLWVRRTVNSGIAVDPTNSAQIVLELSRTA